MSASGTKPTSGDVGYSSPYEEADMPNIPADFR
jgi:hypothetical protein